MIGVGAGATGYVATRGSLQEIRVQEPGFDYVDVPKVSISGGNGTGAVAECKTGYCSDTKWCSILVQDLNYFSNWIR